MLQSLDVRSVKTGRAGRELKHIDILDGWRCLSITLVMVGHLVPLGPSRFRLNEIAATSGMVIFFTLSGFLITRFLIADGDIRRFLIRRIFRILPLAWLGMSLAFILAGGTANEYAGNLLFYANLPPYFLLPAGGHFWSLCLEVQFYLSVALLVAFGGTRTLLLLPILALAVTGLRIDEGAHINIVTWYRIDEILAGATLALIYEGRLGEVPQSWLTKCRFFYFLPLLVLSAAPWMGPLNYARPYVAAALVGASIYNAPEWVRALSRQRVVKYVAQISYALYVFHGIYSASWLGSGEKLVKYAKRPLLLAVTFASSHLSTFYYERYWVGFAHRLNKKKADARVVDEIDTTAEQLPQTVEASRCNEGTE